MIFIKKFKQYIIQPRHQIYDINDDRFMLTDKTHIKINGLIYGYTTTNKLNTYTFYLVINSVLITQINLNMYGNIQYILVYALLSSKMILELEQMDNEEFNEDDDYYNNRSSNYCVTIFNYNKDLRYVHVDYAHPYYTKGLMEIIYTFTLKNMNWVVRHKLFNS